MLIAFDVIFTRVLALNMPLTKIGLGFAAVMVCGMLYGPGWAALCAGLLICRALPPAPHGTYPHKSAKAQHLSTAFPAAVQNALTGCLNVSAFVVFFTVLARLLLHFLPEAFASSLPCALLLGFLELTSGVLSLPCSRAGFLACAALLGWGGLSVHCQTLSVLAATPLSARYYLKGKALQALLSLLLALPALPFLFP